MEDDDVEDDDVKGEADDHVENDDVEEEEEEEKDDDFEEDNVEEEDPKTATQASLRNRNALGRFTRALVTKKIRVKCCGPAVDQDPDTQHTLCERAPSRSIWRFYKSHLIQKFTGKTPRIRAGTHMRSRNALGYFTRATLYGNLQVKCRGPAVDQDPDIHFVRACAVKMHLEISQEQLATETYE